jgi:hypothetical protein
MTDNGFIAVLITGAIVLFGFAIWAAISDSNACTAKGGHLISKSQAATGIGMNGQISIVPVVVDFCVSDDGRIIE